MILFSVVFRVLVALFTQSYFQPDEYFQALEPAHKYVFGYGHLTWEWVNPQPLRSMLYPALNVPVYWLLKVSGLDIYPSLVVAGPRVLHGLLAALTDVWVPKLASVVLDDTSSNGIADRAYLLSITSFFHSLSLSRSLSNSLEVSLTTMALGCFPWDVLAASSSLLDLPKLRRSTIFAGIACAIRPTNAIIWTYMFAVLFWRVRVNAKLLVSILCDTVCVGSVLVLLSCKLSFDVSPSSAVVLAVFTLDSWFYGRPTLTLMNFLLVNASPVSTFYGSSPWHYYLSQALPILCMSALPFVLHGLWLAFTKYGSKLHIMAGCIGWTVSVYSFIGHKEWRFLHPLLPMMHILAAESVIQLIQGREARHAKPTSQNPATWSRPQIAIPLFLLLSIPASVYVVFFHCTGQIEVMSFLRQVPVDNSTTIGFLMPCHSTPWHAYLHRPDLAQPGRMWALGCEPPLGLQNHAEYRDQTDIFFESPTSYIKSHFPAHVDPTFPLSPFAFSVPNATFIQGLRAIEIRSGSWDLGWRHEWPRYIIFFGALLDEPGIRTLFEGNDYIEVWKGGREWEGEGKRKGSVRVWSYRGMGNTIMDKPS
ncbi:glycosyltransferase family 22 protein [Lanmaoa asiatica]|nr:glycosyltransferase family 22 protein [Lanmaoa asiatica]